MSVRVYRRTVFSTSGARRGRTPRNRSRSRSPLTWPRGFTSQWATQAGARWREQDDEWDGRNSFNQEVLFSDLALTRHRPTEQWEADWDSDDEWDVQEVVRHTELKHAPAAPDVKQDGEKDEKEPAAPTCRICLAAPADNIMKKCRHLCLCGGCAKRLARVDSKCPMCRKRGPIDVVYY